MVYVYIYIYISTGLTDFRPTAGEEDETTSVFNEVSRPAKARRFGSAWHRSDLQS